jgi:RimJ/RimL family protein N-acetyltransferase
MSVTPRAATIGDVSHELVILVPREFDGHVPPERACAVMEAELRALGQDIAARRAHARRVAAGGLDRRSAPAGSSQVVVRPIEPGDARELARTFGRLSALSRFRRFLAPLERLSQRQLEYLTCVDHLDHEALIALDAATGAGVGVARYVRDPVQPRRADFATVVADAWQGRGIGALLVSRLAEHAAGNGIEVLEGRTVAANRAARRLAHASLDACAGTLVLTLRIQPQRDAGALGCGRASIPEESVPWPVP